MATALTAQSILARDDDVLSANLDNELVLLSIAQNCYFGSGEVGQRIWDLCETPSSVAAVVAQLTNEFDVEAEQCTAEVLAFGTQMIEAKLLVVQAP